MYMPLKLVAQFKIFYHDENCSLSLLCCVYALEMVSEILRQLMQTLKVQLYDINHVKKITTPMP